MKRLTTVALIVAWVASPACAQRGASHGGFSGHSAPSFHGSSAGSGPAIRGSFTRFRAHKICRPASLHRQWSFPFCIHWRWPISRQSSGPGAQRTGQLQRPVRLPGSLQPSHALPPALPEGKPLRLGRPITSTTPISLGYPYLPDYSDYGDYDDSSASQGYPLQGYVSEPAEQTQPEPPPLPAWPSSNPPQPPPHRKAPNQSRSSSTTVAWLADHNYLLTPTTLDTLDQHRQEIPVPPPRPASYRKGESRCRRRLQPSRPLKITHNKTRV